MENLNKYLKPFEDNKIKLASFYGIESTCNGNIYELSNCLFTTNKEEADKFCEKLNKNDLNLKYRVKELILELNS